MDGKYKPVDPQDQLVNIFEPEEHPADTELTIGYFPTYKRRRKKSYEQKPAIAKS